MASSAVLFGLSVVFLPFAARSEPFRKAFGNCRGLLVMGVITVLYVLMGLSSARVYRSGSAERTDALFIYAVQLAVNLLWSVFFFRYRALLLSLFWLVFLLLLVLLTAVRFERCSPGAGKLQIPYIIWLCFAGCLNLALWLLNR